MSHMCGVDGLSGVEYQTVWLNFRIKTICVFFNFISWQPWCGGKTGLKGYEFGLCVRCDKEKIHELCNVSIKCLVIDCKATNSYNMKKPSTINTF